MAREVVRIFSAIQSEASPFGTYRVVDQRPSGSSDSANGVIEVYEGRDSLGAERWKRIDPQPRDPIIVALLNTLADANVTIPTGEPSLA